MPVRSPDPTVTASLLALIPDPIRSTCRPELVDDELAAVACAPAPGARLSYRLLESSGALYAAYWWASTVAFGDGGMAERKGTCDQGGIQGMWPADGESIGRFLCHESSGEASITWTHEALRVIAYLDIADADHDAAYELWLRAGPVMPEANHSTTSPEVPQ
jgi:hypothetical protein